MSDELITVLARMFGARLRALRASRGWTQRELAERADIPFQSVSRLENGAAAWKLATVVKMARVFGLGPAVFGIDLNILARPLPESAAQNG